MQRVGLVGEQPLDGDPDRRQHDRRGDTLLVELGDARVAVDVLGLALLQLADERR